MKTILFLHREELTYMYVGMTKRLCNMFHIIHVAYSDKEENILRAEGINHHIINFKAYVNQVADDEKINNQLLEEIDQFFISNTQGRFTLNGSIQSDRGFALLTYEQALILSQVYYKFWINIFEKNTIHYVIHEPPSLIFNHICAVMCLQNGGRYIYQIMVSGENNDYTYINITDDIFHSIEIDSVYADYTSNSKIIDIDRCQAFLQSFRSQFSVFLGNMISSRHSYFRLKIRDLKDSVIALKNKSILHPLKDNIEYWLLRQRLNQKRIRNLRAYGKYVTFEQIPPLEKYYYYSLHLEPEAVVLYLADGIYKNQVKLIENIAAQLPAGIYLYVKDHPHEYGYRSVEDYIRLQEIPNIRLLHQSIPGKQVIKNAIGVFTINGTAGLEALLLNKQVYTFGQTFYSVCKRVNYIRNIKDLREILYKNQAVVYNDDDELYAFVNAYLDASKKGVVDFFCNRAGKYDIDMNENIDRISDDFVKFAALY